MHESVCERESVAITTNSSIKAQGRKVVISVSVSQGMRGGVSGHVGECVWVCGRVCVCERTRLRGQV